MILVKLREWYFVKNALRSVGNSVLKPQTPLYVSRAFSARLSTDLKSYSYGPVNKHASAEVLTTKS